ncbi:predicted protein [Histoplasma capsulatum G186AR]|uniref:Uncharacterized protein n=1 Tax=Ajellomyces capsulatus (strain G186AR / H82 / ATCC MYA-2454 / RMSCC 2432) TaxID=447093 RepID=C0NNJ8_AJECG|nr:uncharacterized protein HCBG_04728 [Histoplasma capsulatum G186AR]EEH06508.1 predicted protein [Histoplasma capsulatum G186AR]
MEYVSQEWYILLFNERDRLASPYLASQSLCETELGKIETFKNQLSTHPLPGLTPSQVLIPNTTFPSYRKRNHFSPCTNYYAAYADSHSLKNCGISAHEGQHYLKSSSRPFKRWLAIYGLKKGQKLRKLRPLILVRSLASLETHQHENWTPIGLSGR